ncbi:hypothetical protein JCGZ_06381 [Jatropha curcas]|uniref:Uncharacterized protein n=1 Tax=Jatropha curcas TaxID=180498 RepID=A0A067L191_JATCU|nr:hypothetical protein JCGZ_06381 [Jatropha curcas]
MQKSSKESQRAAGVPLSSSYFFDDQRPAPFSSPSTPHRGSPAFLSLLSISISGERKSHSEALTAARFRQSHLRPSLQATLTTIADKIRRFIEGIDQNGT